MTPLQHAADHADRARRIILEVSDGSEPLVRLLYAIDLLKRAISFTESCYDNPTGGQ